LALVAVVLGSQAAGAQVQRAVHWSARSGVASVQPGDTVRVSLHGVINEFFHLYSTTQAAGGPFRTTIALLPSRSWTLTGKLRAPAPDTIPDGNFGIMSEVYDDSVAIGLTLKANAGDANGAASPRIAVRYQACTTRYCLPPRTDTVIVPVKVSRSSAATIVEPEGAPSRTALDSVAEPRAEPQADVIAFGGAGGIGAFLFLAASMGALALLTPCVFPMVPITVTSFLAVADDRSRGLRLAALYALGIIASFTGLGVITAALFGASGLARFSASPLVNLAVAALFTVFALSLLGVVKLSLPAALVTRASAARVSGDALGTLLMGVVFTLTAFTCTAPFVGTLLVMSAQGSWTWPLIGMLVFSTVFAAPFFALALIPGLLRRRPRAGEWMPTLEITVGAIELAAAIKFASNADLVLGWGVLTRQVVIALWIAILAILVVGLLRFFPGRFAGGGTRPGRFRVATAAIVLALLAVLVPGLFGRRLGELDAFLPPMASHADDARGSAAELAWMPNDYRGALLAASRDRRPILIDFTGYTCTNCRWMEANMFPRAEVKRALAQFVRVRLYTDGLGEPFQSQQLLEQRLFGTVALPLYAVLDADGRPRATFLGMTRDAREFTEFLDRGALRGPR
jgi:thiol:disulfide interchange protein DsbD